MTPVVGWILTLSNAFAQRGQSGSAVADLGTSATELKGRVFIFI